jgi:hypothetical protein
LKTISGGRLKLAVEDYSGDNVKALQNYLHLKEIGTPTQGIDSIHTFKYVLNEK